MKQRFNAGQKLIQASRKGDHALVKEILDEGFDTKNRQIDTAMHCAAEAGHLDIVKTLHKAGVKLGPDPNDRFMRSPPIAGAAANGHIDVVKYLVENGAKPDVMHHAAMQNAMNRDHEEVVIYLAKKGEPLDLLGLEREIRWRKKIEAHDAKIAAEKERRAQERQDKERRVIGKVRNRGKKLGK